MDRLLEATRSLSADPAGDPRVSATACIVHALADALVEHEALNSVLTADGYVVADGVHVGVAIAGGDGLLAQALSDTKMTATLSADQRAVDGAMAARFLGSLKARVEGLRHTREGVIA